MTNIPTDTKTREYWEWAVKNPKDAGLPYGQVEAMSESLTFTDPEYWKKVVADPDAYSYSQHQAEALAEWATKPRSERNPQMTDDDEQFSERQFLAAFSESDNNGTSISWRYWVHQMPSLTAAEFARLACGLDPDLFQSLESRPNKNDQSKLCQKAARIQRLAERVRKESATPSEWFAWASECQIAIHDGFRSEVESALAPPKVDISQTAGTVVDLEVVDSLTFDTGNESARKLRRTPETVEFESKVLEKMTIVWNQWKLKNASEKMLTEPTKGEMQAAVFNMLKDEPHIKGKNKNPTLSMVQDAAKPWKKPASAKVLVSTALTPKKRHAFKGEP